MKFSLTYFISPRVVLQEENVTNIVI